MVSWAKKQSKTLNTVMVSASFLVSLEIISTNLVGGGVGRESDSECVEVNSASFPLLSSSGGKRIPGSG